MKNLRSVRCYDPGGVSDHRGNVFQPTVQTNKQMVDRIWAAKISVQQIRHWNNIGDEKISDLAAESIIQEAIR
jgi:hypothetical protein